MNSSDVSINLFQELFLCLSSWKRKETSYCSKTNLNKFLDPLWINIFCTKITYAWPKKNLYENKRLEIFSRKVWSRFFWTQYEIFLINFVWKCPRIFVLKLLIWPRKNKYTKQKASTGLPNNLNVFLGPSMKYL